MMIILTLAVLAIGTALYCYASARAEQRRQEWHRRCRIDHLKAM